MFKQFTANPDNSKEFIATFAYQIARLAILRNDKYDFDIAIKYSVRDKMIPRSLSLFKTAINSGHYYYADTIFRLFISHAYHRDTIVLIKKLYDNHIINSNKLFYDLIKYAQYTNFENKLETMKRLDDIELVSYVRKLWGNFLTAQIESECFKKVIDRLIAERCDDLMKDVIDYLNKYGAQLNWIVEHAELYGHWSIMEYAESK